MSIKQTYLPQYQSTFTSNRRVTISEHVIQTPNLIRFIYTVAQPPILNYQIRTRAVTVAQIPKSKCIPVRDHRMSVVSKQLKKKKDNQISQNKISKGQKVSGISSSLILKEQKTIEESPYSLKNHISTKNVLEPTCDFFACNAMIKQQDRKAINVESINEHNFKRVKIFHKYKKSGQSDEINLTGQIQKQSNSQQEKQLKCNSRKSNNNFLNDIVMKIIKQSQKTMEESDVPPCVAKSWSNSNGPSEQKVGVVVPFLLLSQE